MDEKEKDGQVPEEEAESRAESQSAGFDQKDDLLDEEAVARLILTARKLRSARQPLEG